MTQTDLDVGPIDYLVVEFPGAKLTGEALTELVDLTDLDGDGQLDLAVLSGIESGLLGDEDLAQGAALVGAGDAVAVLLYENTWAGRFVSALRRQNADVIASGRIPADEVIAALEAIETETSAHRSAD